MLDPKPTSSPSPVSRQPRCSKHRWLWQFMKELLLVGDPALQWVNQREGSFFLRDQDGLATKWECYKKLHKMKAQVKNHTTITTEWECYKKLHKMKAQVKKHTTITTKWECYKKLHKMKAQVKKHTTIT